MKSLTVDIALLPVSGSDVMTAEQAVKAALAVKPQWAVPMHDGAIVGDGKDPCGSKKGRRERWRFEFT